MTAAAAAAGGLLEEKRLMNELYQATAEAKTKPVAEYLETLLDSSETPGDASAAVEKFLFFGHHTCTLDAASEMLRRRKVPFIRIDGSTDTNARQSLVDRFQTDRNARVAVLSIKAAGMGLTLTAASTVIFGELSWTPGDIVQAEDRAHRIGQANAVNVHFLVAKDTVDDIMWGSVANKLETLGQVLDGRRGDALDLKASKPRAAPERTRASRGWRRSSRERDRSPGGRLMDTGEPRGDPEEAGHARRLRPAEGVAGAGAGAGAGGLAPPPEWDEPDDACLLEAAAPQSETTKGRVV